MIRSPGNGNDEVVRRALQEAVVSVARQGRADAHVAGRLSRELQEICDQGRRDVSNLAGDLGANSLYRSVYRKQKRFSFFANAMVTVRSSQR